MNKDAVVAGKIFEVGMKQFPLNEDPQATNYVSHYLDYLMCLNDDTSIFGPHARHACAFRACFGGDPGRA